jgi:hypothetical protein
MLRMTAQIEDVVRFEGEEYHIIGLDGPEPFDALERGFQPRMIHTACYRGYYCAFGVAHGRLRLDRLTVLDDRDEYPPVNGVEPQLSEPSPDGEGGTWRGPAEYVGLELPLSFTGRMRLAREFRQERYVHMGFQRPDAYETVLDLTFEDGRLVDTVDRSAEIGAESAPDTGDDPDEVRRGDMIAWVKDRFSKGM